MRVISFRSIVFLGLIGLSAMCIFAEGEGRVIGTVLAGDKPVANAQVKITRPDVPTFGMEKTTDARGTFAAFILDASRKYRIHIEKDGYRPTDADLTPKVNDTIRVSYSLEPLPPPLTLEQELATPEVDPKSRAFQINLRFSKATYKEEDAAPLKIRRYGWGYPEISLGLTMIDFPAGSLAAADDREAVIKATADDIISQGATKIAENKTTAGTVTGTEMRFKVEGRTLFVRVFVRGDTRYSLIAQAREGEKDALIKRVLDSFQFVSK